MCSFAAHADGVRVVVQLVKHGSERTPEDQECDGATIFRVIKGAILRLTAVDAVIDQDALELAQHQVAKALLDCTLQAPPSTARRRTSSSPSR